MCGIIAVLRQRTTRRPPAPEQIEQALEQALGQLPETAQTLRTKALEDAAAHVERVNALLCGPAGVTALLRNPALGPRVEREVQTLEARIERFEAMLDGGEARLDVAALESLNAALIRLKDAVWTVGRDRLRTAREVRAFAGPAPSSAAIDAYTSIQVALSALDRLEVRGRDSAGIHVLVGMHGLHLNAADIEAELQRRSDPLLTSGAVRRTEGCLSFFYKAAAEIGELGDNVKVLRRAIAADALLAKALQAETAEAVVLAHTRWASVGIISQPNAHPLNQEETDGTRRPYVIAALNGDVDNYADLKATDNLRIAPEITTDAKVIPVLVARRMAAGPPLVEAFRQTVASFIGSVAIAAQASSDPNRLLLAQKGSGQALYVGLAEGAFIVASEPYGLVEETPRYVRMDGETPGNRANPVGSQGQVLVLDRARAGQLEGITRYAYDGTLLPWNPSEVQQARITTRDIDRGAFPHFLLKEISEAPRSFRKTLRGKIVEQQGKLRVELGPQTLPPAVAQGLRDGRIQRVYVIGQGTAAVAGRGVAALMTQALRATDLEIKAMPATELSGFGLRDDMSDTLVVAISQSGTTTDTNRTVDIVRGRGAPVIAIVNRRNSDLCDKADGVLHTSDGRDIEMSVASTKAFYAQIAAGALLAFALAEASEHCDRALEHQMLTALRALPAAMEKVLALRPQIAKAAAAHAPKRRSWAMVGNGNNKVAAEEIRIKLSELCYKAIACDSTEDKKHIDLSSEPLILVCAAGLRGSNADDVAKEVAIYKAHKAAPIVIATEGEARFAAALEVIAVPGVHDALDFVLATVVGHLFGYEAARALDALANPLREARAAIERLAAHVLEHHADLFGSLAEDIKTPAARFFQSLAKGQYDGAMEASTAVRLASLLRFVLGSTPLESFSVEHGKPGTPAVIIEELTAALTRGIEEMTRPVDAIKHQAKTVTVGISRADEELLAAPLVKALLAVGAPRDAITYRDLRTLAALDPAVTKVLGWTRYRIDGDPDHEGAAVQVIGKGGIAKDLRSRAESDPTLRGTKHQVAHEKRLLVACGASDHRQVVITPEVQNGHASGITLLHVQLAPKLDAAALRSVLRGYRDRYEQLRNAVMETEPTFREDTLERVPVAALLTEPIERLAEHWRQGSS